MTDEPHPDSPHETGSSAHPTGDLDDALEEASSLVDEMMEQVGAAQDIAPTPTHDQSPGDETAPPSDIEKELDDLESLVASANQQIATPSEDAEDSPAGGSATDPLPVPDFMAEFTCSAETEEKTESHGGASGVLFPSDGGRAPTGPGPGAGSPGAAAGAKPGMVGTGTIGVVGTPGGPPPPTPQEPPPPIPPAPRASDAPKDREQHYAPPVTSEGFVRSAATRLSPPALRVGARCVSFLEWIDRPFRRVGPSVRRVIGWVAIATTGTSLIVFVLSFL